MASMKNTALRIHRSSEQMKKTTKGSTGHGQSGRKTCLSLQSKFPRGEGKVQLLSLTTHTLTHVSRRATFCSSAMRYFCSKRLHLLTRLLCSVKMEAAVAILSGVLLSLPLLPIVLISSSSLLMLSALRREPEGVSYKDQWPCKCRRQRCFRKQRGCDTCDADPRTPTIDCAQCGSIPLNELQVRCEVNDSGGGSIHTLSLQTEAEDRTSQSILRLLSCIHESAQV